MASAGSFNFNDPDIQEMLDHDNLATYRQISLADCHQTVMETCRFSSENQPFSYQVQHDGLKEWVNRHTFGRGEHPRTREKPSAFVAAMRSTFKIHFLEEAGVAESSSKGRGARKQMRKNMNFTDQPKLITADVEGALGTCHRLDNGRFEDAPEDVDDTGFMTLETTVEDEVIDEVARKCAAVGLDQIADSIFKPKNGDEHVEPPQEVPKKIVDEKNTKQKKMGKRRH